MTCFNGPCAEVGFVDCMCGRKGTPHTTVQLDMSYDIPKATEYMPVRLST